MTTAQQRDAARGRLDGEVAIVTGGGGGIGRAIASRLVVAGAKVGIFDASERAARETVSHLGETTFAVVGDCVDSMAVGEAVDSIEAQLGPASILVNAAGVADPCPADQLDLAAWTHTIGVNLTGTFHFVESCVPGMIQRGHGRILNIASISGHRGGQRQSVAYAASKGGILALTRTLGVQLAPYGITVNSISPGIVRTRMSEPLLAGLPEDAVTSSIPVGREGEPDDIADATAFLVGREASFVNATDLVVDGGHSAMWRIAPPATSG